MTFAGVGADFTGVLAFECEAELSFLSCLSFLSPELAVEETLALPIDLGMTDVGLSFFDLLSFLFDVEDFVSL